MRAIDKYLRHVRISKARKYIKQSDAVLDIGTGDGIMFEKLRGLIKSGVGIDPLLSIKSEHDYYTLLPGYFPDACPGGTTYDVITMLAVLEHIPDSVQLLLAERCFELLNKNGRIIITVPSPKVDHILKILKWAKLADGMSLEEHYGFRPELTPKIFSDKYFHLTTRKLFQFGLNNLFVFKRKEVIT
jgi:2-polyprenyl-3-methyl-5-hydroxy-6-metoxy-1,4-benzoquinol methylase